MKFRDSPQYKRGEFGQDIVRQWLQAKGYITYSPDQKDRAHAFDFLTTWHKKRVAIVEVKTKPRRKYYPDTGIDIRHYNDYMALAVQGISVYLAFVDEILGCIYIGNLQDIGAERVVKGKQYPIRAGGKIYFHLGNILPDYPDDDTGMKIVYRLDDRQCNDLKTMETTRNYDYD